MIVNLVTAAVAMGVAAPLISSLKSWFARRPNSPVEVKVGKSQVILDLAKDLPPDELKTLVQGAVASIQHGDAAGLAKIVSDSHMASNRVRLAKSETAA